MSEHYIKAEIVQPKKSADEVVIAIFTQFFGLAVRVLFVWWAVAVWFPEFGLTYWQLVLPVYALRMLINPPVTVPRIIK